MKSNFRMLATLATLALAVAATPASAAVETLELDRSHTNIGFSVRHFFTPVKGEFKEMKGTILYDTANPANSKVEVTIPTASINTNHEKRDGHLRTADFFDAENHPTITFVSKAITLDAATKKGTMTGDLTMRGVTKPVTLDIEVLGIQSAGKSGGSIAGFSGRGKINRKDFGINWNNTLDNGSVVLADEVELILDVEAKTPRPAQPPAAAAAADKK
jgi:polyisoprenoid-binding protein YceI